MRRKWGLVLLVSGLVLSILSVATCQFGVRYERGKIPAERVAQMGDYDWIGLPWIGLGWVIFGVGLLCLIAGLILRRGGSRDQG